MKKVITLSNTEIQSGIDRVRMAQNLIEQLPNQNETKENWLLMFGRGSYWNSQREKRNLIWSKNKQCIILNADELNEESGMSFFKGEEKIALIDISTQPKYKRYEVWCDWMAGLRKYWVVIFYECDERGGRGNERIFITVRTLIDNHERTLTESLYVADLNLKDKNLFLQAEADKMFNQITASIKVTVGGKK